MKYNIQTKPTSHFQQTKQSRISATS